MTIDIARLKPRPAGFGQCQSCAYRDVGPPAICYACFREWSRPPPTAGCRACGRPDLELGICGNPYCNRDRFYDRNVTISYREGVLQAKMNAYKFGGVRGWGLIFARILLGYLNTHAIHFQDYDLIVATPTYQRSKAAQNTNSPGFIIRLAAKLDQHGWAFDAGEPTAITKTTETTAMKGKTWPQREEIAETELRAALAIPDRGKTRNKRILAFDDLYTTGHTLNEVARCLIQRGGARQVTGLSLARQLYAG